MPIATRTIVPPVIWVGPEGFVENRAAPIDAITGTAKQHYGHDKRRGVAVSPIRQEMPEGTRQNCQGDKKRPVPAARCAEILTRDERGHEEPRHRQPSSCPRRTRMLRRRDRMSFDTRKYAVKAKRLATARVSPSGLQAGVPEEPLTTITVPPRATSDQRECSGRWAFVEHRPRDEQYQCGLECADDRDVGDTGELETVEEQDLVKTEEASTPQARDHPTRDRGGAGSRESPVRSATDRGSRTRAGRTKRRDRSSIPA